MPKQSAGILMYRKINSEPEVLLVHPGGPFFKNKDIGAWSIPKGEFLDDEEPLAAAKREFKEETGHIVNGSFLPLNPVHLKSGKKIYAWAIEGNLITEEVVSNLFEIEWPPKSGKKQAFAEIDKAAWFNAETAKSKINAGQVKLIEELLSLI